MDWVTDVVALAQFPKLELTVNGEPITAGNPNPISQGRLSFEYDLSGNRIGRKTIVLSAPQSVPSRVSRNNNDDYWEDSTSTEDDFSIFNAMEMPENNDVLDKFYTDKLNESDVVIYPNPTRGALAVEIRNKNPEIPHQLTVLNMRGSIIFQQSSIGSYTQIDLSSQPTGIYLLRISSQNSFITWKIIKE